MRIETLINQKNDAEIKAKIEMFNNLVTQEENVIKRRAGLYGISVITVSLYKVSIKYFEDNILFFIEITIVLKSIAKTCNCLFQGN